MGIVSLQLHHLDTASLSAVVRTPTDVVSGLNTIAICVVAKSIDLYAKIELPVMLCCLPLCHTLSTLLQILVLVSGKQLTPLASYHFEVYTILRIFAGVWHSTAQSKCAEKVLSLLAKQVLPNDCV